MLTRLPPLVTDVMVPGCFSPSALVSSGECRLKLAIASLGRSEWDERLPSGPQAAVGILLHRVLQRARRAGASPQEAFDEEYARVVDELRRDSRRAHYAELASTRSASEWSRLKAWVLTRVQRESTRSEYRGGGPRDGLYICGSEVPLKSHKLRLRGRADSIRQIAPETFEIRDFKTGTALNERGEIKRDIVLQLQAYGLLLLEVRPDAAVRLVVDDGVERDVPFDLDARRQAMDEIVRIVASMPPPGSAPARDLTVPGSSCFGCSVRHICPEYRAHAPGWWKQYPRNIDRLPNDVWGTTIEVRVTGRVDLILRDDAGRRVRIDGLAERHGLGPSVLGRRIWFFGLEATGATRGFDGARFHPRYFHELPRDGMERRAWGLQVFIEAESD